VTVPASLSSSRRNELLRDNPDQRYFIQTYTQRRVAGCVAIQDSLAGVRAAERAGMRILGFTGRATRAPGHRTKLMEAGAHAALAPIGELQSMLPGGFDQLAEAS
jgi:beta-phosphoglucomutase-like phosphatase (HAD superfamily)